MAYGMLTPAEVMDAREQQLTDLKRMVRGALHHSLWHMWNQWKELWKSQTEAIEELEEQREDDAEDR